MVSVIQARSCDGFDVTGDIPDEAGELSCNRHADFVSRQVSSRRQVPEALRQSQCARQEMSRTIFGCPCWRTSSTRLMRALWR
jgi:hypothetical protein